MTVDYDSWKIWDPMKVYGPTARHTRRLIRKLLQDIKPESILDVGCGSGLLLSVFASIYPNARLAGAEYHASGLQFAKKRVPQASFHVFDLAQTRLDEQFDLVTAIDVLEHIPDDVQAMKNLSAMAKKYVLVAVPLGPLYQVEAERYGHVHGYSRKEFLSKLEQAHLIPFKVIQWGFPFYNIMRRIVNKMPASATTGNYSTAKKVESQILYRLFYLNIGWHGERLFVLCKK